MDDYVSISTPDHIDLDFELAGLGSRFTALVVDGLCLAALMLVLLVGMILLGIGLGSLHSALTSITLAVWILLAFLVIWGYFVFFETIMKGQTPGKKATGIRVLRDDGLPIGLREAAIRNLVRAADMLPPPSYLLGGIVVNADRMGRRLGDMAAGTIVVRERFVVTPDFGTGASWAARIERGQSRYAITLPKGTITAQQLGLIEQFLRRRDALPAARRDQLAWQIAEPLLESVGMDRAMVGASQERTAWCEQILLAIVELASKPADQPAAAVAQGQIAPSSLF